MGGFLTVNPGSGDKSRTTELLDAARVRGIDTRVLRPGESPERLAREATADVIGVAGGDGSLATVASIYVKRGLQFVCIPCGTRNHLPGASASTVTIR